jgi:hypothetical protein
MAPLDMDKALDWTKEWSPSLLFTADFITPVLQPHGTRLTAYLRPVNWILVVRRSNSVRLTYIRATSHILNAVLLHQILFDPILAHRTMVSTHACKNRVESVRRTALPRQ